MTVELRPRLYRLLFGRYQAYLWRDDDGVTLIDSGPPGSAPTIEESLREIGASRADVRRLVLTHFHDDHAGSAAEVASWGADVVAHAADAPIIRGDRPGPAPNLSEFERRLQANLVGDMPPAPPVAVDRVVDDGDVLGFAGGAVVIATPGHTDGSIALHLAEHRVLFTGDTVAEHEGNVILGVFNLDREQTVASFRRLAELDVDVACVGHGEPILGDASSRLSRSARDM